MVTKQQLEEGLARFNQVGAMSAQPLASESSDFQTFSDFRFAEVPQNLGSQKKMVKVRDHTWIFITASRIWSDGFQPFWR